MTTDDHTDEGASKDVNVQLLNDDGTATDIPFTHKEFDRLSREAAAAKMPVAEYIKKKIETVASADHAKALQEWAALLRSCDGKEQTLSEIRRRTESMGMRNALEVIVAVWGGGVGGEISDEAMASTAFAIVCQVSYRACVATTLEQELRGLRDRFAAAEADLAQKTAALRTYNREASTERLEVRVAEAREAERAVVAAELEKLRAEGAKQRSEIDELRASKKKLREALERAKEKAP